MKLQPFKCVICKKMIEHEFGHNPYPIADLKDGKCCQQCDNDLVLPARLNAHQNAADTKLLSVGPPPNKFNSDFDNIRTMRRTMKDDSVKKQLLDAVRKPRLIGLDEKIDISSGKERFIVRPKNDDRPLIDKVHEATFHNPVGLQWIEDKYAMRMLLRKAHCFTVDDTTSAMIADFSIAISSDLETARRLAIPPYPVTWFEINNKARINRIKALGLQLTPTAAGEVAGPVVEKVGWLIHEDKSKPDGSYFAMYFTQVDQGIMAAPLPYWWHITASNPGNVTVNESDESIKLMKGMTFGIETTNVHPYDACLGKTGKMKIDRQVAAMMMEIAGELRHIWGMLIALGAGQFGTKTFLHDQKPHDKRPIMPNGKPLLPLEHKLLHLHLNKRSTSPEKIVTKAFTQHRMREHDVRAHWRTLRNADGSIKMRVQIPSHKRGDPMLGRIEKTYKVER